MKKIAIILPLILIVFGCDKAQVEVNTDRSAEEILQSFVEDFREDPFASEPITFGVRVRGEGGGDWLIDDEGKTEEDDESVIIAKTVDKNVKKTIKRIKKLHSYELPDIIVIPIIGGHIDYLDYIANETS